VPAQSPDEPEISHGVEAAGKREPPPTDERFPEIAARVDAARKLYDRAGMRIPRVDAFDSVASLLAADGTLETVLRILTQLGNIGVTALERSHFVMIDRYRNFYLPKATKGPIKPYRTLDYHALPVLPASSPAIPPLDTPASDLDDLTAEIRGLTRHAAETSADYELCRNTVIRAFERLHAQARSGERTSGLPTGFRRLDAMTGGLPLASLTIVGGRPGSGKTSFALNLAVNACHSRLGTDKPATVIIFSLEQPRDQVIGRMLSSEARVCSSRLKTGQVHREDWQSLAQAAGTLSDLPLFIKDKSRITVAEMRDFLSGVAHHRDLALVVIDYVQLIVPEVRGETREREATEISRSLKLMARELDVPILAVSQLNRGLEQRGVRDKRPWVADLRDTGALEEDADLVLLVYRDEVYNRETLDQGIAEIIVGKQRNGPTGTVKLRFFDQYTRFDNLADED
jgi:replicative DNA helicase